MSTRNGQVASANLHRDTAFNWLDCGFSPLPPGRNKARLADIETGDPSRPRTWEPYQTTPATRERIDAWYRHGCSGNGVVTGFGNLTLFEFDDRATYASFKAVLEALGYGDLVARIEAGYCEETPGGGIHWFYVCEEVRPCTKLAERPVPGEPHKRKTLIETKGRGGFAVVSPSCGNVHPTGRAYVLLSGRVDLIETITPAEQRILFDVAETLSEVPEAAPATPARSKGAPDGGGRPGDAFAAATTWQDILEPLGWTRSHQLGDVIYWCRPGKVKAEGISATTGHCTGQDGAPLLYVFSTSTQFTPRKAVGKFAAYALLHHSGDYGAAARELARRGYGEQKAARAGDRAAPSLNAHLGTRTAEIEIHFRNWEWEEIDAPKKGDASSVEGDGPRLRKAAIRIEEIAEELDALVRGWPKRVGEQLFIASVDFHPVFLNSAPRLFAWIDVIAAVDWTKGSSFITQERFYEHLRMTFEQYDAIETLPHWPAIPGVYYMHEPIPRGGGRLEELLDFFKPASDIDRELIKALILTLFWGGSPGQRPGFLVTGPDDDQEQGRGVGKSKLIDILSEELGGGYVDVMPTDEMKNVKTRLLSTEDGRKRVVRLDNVKTHRFSWADLEGLMTSTVISGHSMYHGEGRRPNLLIWLITLNGASLSKDMAQRVIVIKLARPEFRGGWEDEVRAFCRTHRLELLGDIGEILERAPGQLNPKLRWATWERDVLTKLADYRKVEDEIKNRQGAIDDDQEEKELIIEFFRDRLIQCGHDPETDAILIPSAVVARWISEATRKHYASNQASAFLRGLAIPMLHKSDRSGSRIWQWTGPAAKETASVRLNPEPRPHLGSVGSDGGSGRFSTTAWSNSRFGKEF
jgi:hypothetical protein